jgi:hypothetical protein
MGRGDVTHALAARPQTESNQKAYRYEQHTTTEGGEEKKKKKENEKQNEWSSAHRHTDAWTRPCRENDTTDIETERYLAVGAVWCLIFVRTRVR